MSPTHSPEIQVEAVPMLQKQRHKESIVCYEVNPAAIKAAVHKPKLELHRGTIAIGRQICCRRGGSSNIPAGPEVRRVSLGQLVFISARRK